MKTYIEILNSPRETIGKICQEPTWRAAALFSASALFVLMWLGGCWQDLRQGLEWTSILGPALVTPLIVSIVALGTTAAIYALIVLGTGGSRWPVFKTLFSINIHCGAIFLLGEIINFLLMRTNILGDHATPLRGRFPVGLDILLLAVDDPNIYLAIILHSTSVFLIWYLVVLSLGIHIATGMSKTRATLISASLWITIVLLALSVAYAAGGDTTLRVRL
jgi:hypothetical protein